MINLRNYCSARINQLIDKCRVDLSAEESEALDVAYVQNWSIMGDIVLLFRTVGAVLSHKGAY